MREKLILALFLLLIFVTGCAKENNESVKKVDSEMDNEIKVEEKIDIVDMDSDSRPYAVVINNFPSAVKVQTGLNDAYMIYEFPVEGGMSRSLALYKDKTTSKIGTVRSSRHNFIDYVMENDAIYVHFGWSKYAKADQEKLNTEEVNGLYDSGFWRENPLDLAVEHTAYTSLENAEKVANNRGYSLTTEVKPILNYKIEEVNLNEKENSLVANTVSIPYSGIYEVKYEYDSANKNYTRYVNDVKHTDYFTDEVYTAKNIIVVKIDFTNTSDNQYLDLHNIGNGEGYYITNGYAVPITWEKTSRESITKYKYLDGSSIEVNDGNTYLMYQSINRETVLK